MKRQMKKMKVIYYSGRVDLKLDRKIEKALRSIGCRRYASGCNRKTKERDLAFEYEAEVEEKK